MLKASDQRSRHLKGVLTSQDLLQRRDRIRSAETLLRGVHIGLLHVQAPEQRSKVPFAPHRGDVHASESLRPRHHAINAWFIAA